MGKKIIILVIAICGAQSSLLHARWLSIADAPSKNSYTKTVSVNADGTHVSVVEMKKEILTAVGRDYDSNITLYYNGDSEKIKILAAKTVYRGKEYVLDKKLIEDKPLASTPSGFDQMRQVMLAFPRVEKGAIIYVKYETQVYKAILPNFFAMLSYFGDQALLDGAHISIQSKLPLYVKINDPHNALKVVKKQNAGLYNLEINLTKPIYNGVMGEPYPYIVPQKSLTWVSLSSLNDWQEFAVRESVLWKTIFQQKLPKIFQQILMVAKKQHDEVSQINTVTSLLNEKVRYMGDWRTIKGRFVPRSLQEISKTQFGDCKDFAAVTVAMLTKLGFKARCVLVRRGITDLSLNILPNMGAFNHAMVKVVGKNGKVYWIDPTNFASMAVGIFPDIAGKMALVLDTKTPGYERIPAVNYKQAVTIQKRQWHVLNNNTIIENGEVDLKNEKAFGLVGGTSKFSADLIKDVMFYFLADMKHLNPEDKKMLVLPPLDSRIVHDLNFKYSFIRRNQVIATNVGPALKLTYDAGAIQKICEIAKDNVTDVLITDMPETLERQTIVKGVEVQNIEFFNKEIKTPWLYVKRECSLHDHNLQINDTIIVYKNLLSNDDIKKPIFFKLKDWLENNFKNVVIVFGRK